MTRRITLPLGSTTSADWCGNCRVRIGASCPAFGLIVRHGSKHARHEKCRAAEVKDEDGAIIRLLALLVRAPTDDDGRPEIECGRETLVDMAMAARRELDALRAKTKDEEVGDA